MRSWRHDDKVNVDVHVDSDWAKGPERKSTGQWAREEIHEWRNDDDQRHGRETFVQNASDACVEHGRSRVLRSRNGCSRGTWNAVDDGRLGREPPTCESGLTPTLPKRWRREGFGKTRHVELRYLWLQDVTKKGRVKMRRIPGEQNLADHLTKGKAWYQIETLIRGSRRNHEDEWRQQWK